MTNTISEAEAKGRGLRGFFQPARIIYGNALAKESTRPFEAEARFPWYPVTITVALLLTQP
jgi:hypothetical protein